MHKQKRKKNKKKNLTKKTTPFIFYFYQILQSRHQKTTIIAFPCQKSYKGNKFRSKRANELKNIWTISQKKTSNLTDMPVYC